MREVVFSFILILISCLGKLNANTIEFLQDTDFLNTTESTVATISYSKFSQDIDLLNYSEGLTGTKLNSATAKTFALTQEFNNLLRVALEYTKENKVLERTFYPYTLESDSDSYFLSINYPFFTHNSKVYNFEIFIEEDNQQSLEVDCYQFGSEIIGGSCSQASIRFFDSDIFQQTGEKVFKPALKIDGDSNAYGFTLRIIDRSEGKIRFNHSIGLSRTKIQVNYLSEILQTTDPFLLGSMLGGFTVGSIINAFKKDIPQTSPWYENKFKYAFTSSYQVKNNLFLSARFSIIKVSRSNFISHEIKRDFNTNKLIDFGLFFSLSENIGFYSRLALSSNYLLGVNSLAYNRKSSNFFDDPYGEVYIGLLINF